MSANKMVETVLVVGAGVMGSSIAQLFASAKIRVLLADVDEKALERALGLIESGLDTMAAYGKIPRERIPGILALISPCIELEEVTQNVDFIIEAVPEVPEIKKEIFLQLDRRFPAGIVIASNTSGLDIFRLADVKQPERLIIAHFFAPAHIIPLVEVVPGEKTAPQAVSRTVELMQKLGQAPVVMKRFGPGFIVNRIQKAIGETALEMIEQGLASPEEIDRAVKLSLGIRLPLVGVVQTFDFQGLGMLLATMKNYGKIYPFIEEKVNQGRLGVKTAKGIYDYGSRSEAEILKKRDLLFLKMLETLQQINAFEPL